MPYAYRRLGCMPIDAALGLRGALNKDEAQAMLDRYFEEFPEMKRLADRLNEETAAGSATGKKVRP